MSRIFLLLSNNLMGAFSNFEHSRKISDMESSSRQLLNKDSGIVISDLQFQKHPDRFVICVQLLKRSSGMDFKLTQPLNVC